jgi:hypothetical protein
MKGRCKRRPLVLIIADIVDLFLAVTVWCNEVTPTRHAVLRLRHSLSLSVSVAKACADTD